MSTESGELHLGRCWRSALRHRQETLGVLGRLYGDPGHRRKRPASGGKPVGLVSDDADRRIRIWVKTWGEIIHDAEHRGKYVKQQLGVAPDQRGALDDLRRVHGEKLPNLLIDGGAVGAT